MTRGRISNICIKAMVLNCLLIGTAFAGFFGGDDKGKSGLDFNGGYDLNTVRTLSGRALAPPHAGEQGSVLAEISSGKETLGIALGPESYWGKNGIAIRANDELSVKGSKAQGQDGKSYLLVQKLVNRTTGAQLELRSEKGEPAWSGRNGGIMRSDGGAGGMMRNQGAGMMRGSGAGMMRR